MGRVELHPVAACFLNPDRAVDELADQGFDLLRGQSPGLLLYIFTGNRGRRHHGLASDQSGNRLAPRMVQLNENLCSMFMYRPGQPGKRLNVAVLGDGKLAQKSGSVDVVYPCDFRQDQPGAPDRPRLIVGDHVLRRRSVQIRKADPHRGHDQPVFHRYRSDLSWLK